MANPEVFDAANDCVEFLMENVSDGITLNLIDRHIDSYSIEDCLSFSYKPIIPTVNFHFQSTDVPTCDADDLEEPTPPTEQRVEWTKKEPDSSMVANLTKED